MAIALADKCHYLASCECNPEHRFIFANRGFETLGVNLTEPYYDYYKKLRTVPQVISLLEDLKVATESIKSLSKLSFFISPTIFPKDCIPQAQVCTLLTVAYGGNILVEKDICSAQSNIFKNGKKAIKLYEKGLNGPTTPEKREYYHKQIVNLVYGLYSRTPHLFEEEALSYTK